MTEAGGPPSGDFKQGDIADGHILTAAGWLPLRHLPTGASGPFYAGDARDGFAFTGVEWVSIPSLTPPPSVDVPSAKAAVSEPRMTLGSQGRGRRIALVVGLAATIAALVTGAVMFGSEHGNSGTVRPAQASVSTSIPTSIPITGCSGAACGYYTPPPEEKHPNYAAIRRRREARYEAHMKASGWFHAGDLWERWDRTTSDQFSVTFHLRVITPKGCPDDVYVEGNITDRNGTVVDYANDSLPSLAPNQQAVLNLVSTYDGSVTIHLTKAMCY